MQERSRPKLLYVITEDWYFWSHRVGLARAARDAGFDVVVATKVDRHGDQIIEEGFRLIPLDLSRGSANPIRDLRTLIALVKIYRAERPNLVHHVAVKPVIYGTVAAKLVGVHGIVNALAGLGYVFSSNEFRARFFRRCIQVAFRALLDGPRTALIVQNRDDLLLFQERRIVRQESIVLIRGSGVDPSIFAGNHKRESIPIVVLPARMLWDKGVGEFVAAAGKIRGSGIAARFVLVGGIDPENPAAVAESVLRSWVDQGDVEWWGHVSEMASVFAQAAIVCLPSYREGLPKALLEAAAAALPIVTCDSPGCREVVEHGINGLLVAPRDVDSLTAALLNLLSDTEMREEMGKRGRERVIQEFSLDRVVSETLAVYQGLLT